MQGQEENGDYEISIFKTIFRNENENPPKFQYKEFGENHRENNFF